MVPSQKLCGGVKLDNEVILRQVKNLFPLKQELDEKTQTSGKTSFREKEAEKLEELFSQHEICMLFRQRAKRIVAELKKCATPISFFEDLIYYANMSTLIMNQAIAEGLAYQSEHERKGPRKQDGSCICTHMNAKGWFAK